MGDVVAEDLGPRRIREVRHTWYDQVRPSICERACIQKHKSSTCEIENLCPECLPYYCKFLTQFLGLKPAEVTGHMALSDQKDDALANYYWTKLMRAKCAQECSQEPRCPKCIRRYQMSTYFVPGNNSFRNELVARTKGRYGDRARKIDLRKLRDETVLQLEELLISAPEEAYRAGFSKMSEYLETFEQDAAMQLSSELENSSSPGPLGRGESSPGLLGSIIESPGRPVVALSADISRRPGTLFLEATVNAHEISAAPSYWSGNDFVTSLPTLKVPGTDSIRFQPLSIETQRLLRREGHVDWDSKLDKSTAAAVASCLDSLSGLTEDEVSALKTLRALHIDLFRDRPISALFTPAHLIDEQLLRPGPVVETATDLKKVLGGITIVPLPIDYQGGGTDKPKVPQRTISAVRRLHALIKTGPASLPDWPHAYASPSSSVTWDTLSSSWVARTEKQQITFPTSLWPFGVAKALAISLAMGTKAPPIARQVEQRLFGLTLQQLVGGTVPTKVKEAYRLEWSLQ